MTEKKVERNELGAPTAALRQLKKVIYNIYYDMIALNKLVKFIE
jgi:hypothetical protein